MVANGNRDVFPSHGFNPFTQVLGTVVGKGGWMFSLTLHMSERTSDFIRLSYSVYPSLPKIMLL